MERKRTSSQRSTIVTDRKAEQQDTASKTLKLSLSTDSKLKSNTFLFDAHPHDNQEKIISILIRVTENDISEYCSEPVKALEHINALWKSFISCEAICVLLVRILCQIMVKCSILEDCVKDMLLHFITNKSPSVQSYVIDVFRQIAAHFTLEKEFHQTALSIAQEHISSVHHNIRASCLNLIGQLISMSSDKPSLVAMVLHCLTDGDYRVRRAALEAMSTMVATGDEKILGLSAYKEVSLLLYDDTEQVRIQAAKLLWRLGSLLGSNKISLKDSDVEINVLDDSFIKICDLMNDISMKVRTLAAKLMGTFSGVTYKFLEQTLDKKLMSHLKHVKSDHERQRESFQSGGASNSMDWDSGKKWGQGTPQGTMVNKNEIVLMSQGACGAFVHGLEDEYMEVRKASMESICQLSAGNLEFAARCLDFLVDMFNDEIEAVRLHSITCLCRVSSNITLRDDQLEPVLNVLKDKSSDIREAVHSLLCCCHLTSTSGLRLTVNALLGNLSKYPQDKVSIWKCLKMIGSNHGHLSAALVPELLSTHPFFMTAEPDVDDPAYICVLVLIFNATRHCPTLPVLFPSHVFRHYTYLNDALPDIVPQLNVMNCTVSRSCDLTPKCQRGSSVTETFLSKTLDRINGLRSHDAHQTIETCISDLNKTALLDQALSAPLHYVAMVCKCYLLLNKVKLALSQDIVLTTISPQRSVMATAVHNLQEVMSLSYQLQHCYQGQQADMLCSIVQLRVITHAMQLLLAMQLNIDVTNSDQFIKMKESMARRLVTVSQFYSTSGCSCPASLEVLLDDDIIMMSPDTLANLLQPVINDDPPLCLQLSLLLPLRQASAVITTPSEEDGIGDNTTTFVASLALLLNVRALLYNVTELSRVAVKVTFPDQRQLFYQPKPSEIRNISATTDSLQASVVLSHAAWTEACQVEMSIVQRLTVDSNEAVADCLSRALSVNAATSSANIAAAKDILYGEALPLSNPVTLTLLPKPDM